VELGNDITICFEDAGGPYLDAGRNYDTYLWSTGQSSRVIQASDTGRYSVLVSLRGCEATDTITIHNLCPFIIYLPNAITSYYADGNNDYFYLPTTEKIKEMIISIYDRWGQLVFESTDANFKWNGTVNGTITPNTVINYRLFIISSDGKRHIFKGHITVL
jgi:gliding motility-associated-like protein